MSSFTKKEYSKFLKNPVCYQGSKRLEIDKLTAYTPDLDTCDKVVDLFGGGGVVSLYFKQKIPNKTVIYNDLNPIQYKLFKLLKDRKETESVLTKINKYVYNKNSYETLHNFYFDSKEQDLTTFLILKRHAYRGLIKKGFTTVNLKEGKTSKRNSYKNFLKYHSILNDKFVVMNSDFRKVLNKYKDDDKAFIYMDPPYLTTNCGPYHSFTKNDLDYLIDFFKNPAHKCKMMLHIEFVGYTYDKLKDFIKCYYPKNYAISSKKNKKKIPKSYILIATNYEITAPE